MVVHEGEVECDEEMKPIIENLTELLEYDTDIAFKVEPEYKC